jgi:uncharacterized protein (DUF362 family)
MITRRRFLIYSAGALASVSLGGIFPKYASGKTKTKVCIIESPRIWKSGSIDRQVVGSMLDAGVRTLSGSDDLAKAWKTYFAPNDTIAFKVNPVARQTGSTKPEVCDALAQTIHRNIGVPYDNFIIFDVSKDDLVGAGYEITRKKRKIQIYASTDYSKILSLGGVNAKISRVITDECTALVNVPLLKTHKGAGISIALKNHYGSIPTPVVRDDANRYHMDRFKNLVFLNLMPPIYDKTRLIVVDGLVSQYNRGPGGDPRYQWKFNGIVMGTDPVAVDSVCARIINQKRVENSLPPLDLPYLEWARQEGLGMNRLEELLIYERIV